MKANKRRYSGLDNFFMYTNYFLIDDIYNSGYDTIKVLTKRISLMSYTECEKFKTVFMDLLILQNYFLMFMNHMVCHISVPI